MSYQKEAYMLRTAVPCPISGRDVIRMPRFLHSDRERSVRYSAQLAQEMKAKADSGARALENEKLRFYWMVSAPFYATSFKFLEERGLATVIFEFGGASRSSDYKKKPARSGGVGVRPQAYSPGGGGPLDGLEHLGRRHRASDPVRVGPG